MSLMAGPPNQSARASTQPRSWTFDPSQTVLAVTAKRMGAKWVDGRFVGVTGNLRFDSDQPLATTCHGELDIRRFLPGAPRMNTELRIEDFLDAEHHSRIPFAGRVVEQVGPSAFRALATVTIRDHTPEIALDLSYLGQQQTPAPAGPGSGRPVTRVALRATALLARGDLDGSTEGARATAAITAGGSIAITLDINAILDAEPLLATPAPTRVT